MTDRLTLITSLREREAGERNHYLAGTEIVEWSVEPKVVRAEYWHGLERIQEYEMNIGMNLSQNAKAASHLSDQPYSVFYYM